MDYRSIFAGLIKLSEMTLSDKEKELIEAIRILKKTKHNYSIEYEWHVRELFERLIDDDETDN